MLACDVDREGARAIGNRFIASLHSPISTDRASHQVGVAIGAATIPQDGVTPEEILCNADIAMYRAKAEDRSALVFFQVENAQLTSTR